MGHVEQVERVEQGGPASAPRRHLLAIVAGIVLVSLGGVAAWWFSAVHPGNQLAGIVGGTMCFAPVATSEGELVRGGIDLDVPSATTILAVRLVDPQNLELAHARVVPVVADDDGGVNVLGATTGWPIADPAQYTVDWTGDRDLVGAHLRPGIAEAPYVHLHVIDPSKPASTEGWEVEYRMYATKWVSTLHLAVRLPTADQTCDDVL